MGLRVVAAVIGPGLAGGVGWMGVGPGTPDRPHWQNFWVFPKM